MRNTDLLRRLDGCCLAAFAERQRGLRTGTHVGQQVRQPVLVVCCRRLRNNTNQNRATGAHSHRSRLG